MTQMIITKDNLKILIESLIGDMNVFAPKKADNNTILYSVLKSFDEYAQNVLLTNTSAKERVYLQSEKMFSYSKQKDTVDLKEDLDAKENAILAAGPVMPGVLM